MSGAMTMAAPVQKAALKPRQAATTKPRQTAGARLLLQRKCACGAPTSNASDECDECRTKKIVGLQTKLRINAPGDAYEQEADRIAEQVLAKPVQPGVTGAPVGVQRYAGESNGPMSTVPDNVGQVLASPGRPLEPALRRDMEQRFGHNFSRVRVHTDARAAESALAVNALAYTVGRDVVFGQGRYAPETNSGRRLLAHELTHVVQQHGLGSAAPRYGFEARHDDRFEGQADAASGAVLRGRPVGRIGSSLHRPILQRFPLGLLVPLLIGAVGIIATLVSEGTFSERDLQAYLEYLSTRRRIEGGFFSDNKARALVKRWASGDSKFDLNRGYTSRSAEISAVDLKRLLIQEMLDGRAGDGDQKAILTILEYSSNDDVLKILDPALGVSVQKLDDNIHGDNHRRFSAMLERRFPQLGDPNVLRRGQFSCDARQAIMLEFARGQAIKMIAAVIPRLIGYLAADPDKRRSEFKDVQSALQCYFPQASNADVDGIKQVFEKAEPHLQNAQYRCIPEGAERITIKVEGVPTLQGQERTIDVPKYDLGLTPFFEEAPGVHTADVRTFIAPTFFTTLGPVQQAVTLIHEAIHRVAFAIEDIDYDLPCGKLNLERAKRNSESFAQLALRLLEREPGTIAFKGTLPAVLLGNFRNTGPVSKENKCEECRFLPGLGPDTTNSAQNLMELRGDITGHRAGAEYDFSRTKERAIWKRVGAAWALLNYVPPGTSDNVLSNDQDVTPKNDHIYVVDGAGFDDPDHPVPDPSADEAVYRGTFVESVRARLRGGVWSRVSNDFPWHSVTWMEKVNGKWRRKPGANEIEPGRITVGKAPPAQGPVQPEKKS